MSKKKVNTVDIVCPECNKLIEKVKIEKNQEICYERNCPGCGLAIRATVKSEDVPDEQNANLMCPHCKKQNLYGVKNDEDEYTCMNCSKNFKAIIGTVESAKGLLGYVARTASIRIKGMITGNTIVIQYYSTRQGTDLNRGDRTAIIFKKGFLSKNYSSKPSLIQNYNLSTTWIGA